MSPKKTVTVVVPVFNGASHIETTLSSVVDQSFTDWHCLLINDGSTDNSLELINAFIQKHQDFSFSVITTSNQGPGAARNVGIDSSNSPFIAFLDQDDIWHREKLALQIDYLRKNTEIDGVLCHFEIASTRADGTLLANRLIKNTNLKNLARKWISLEGNGAFISSCLLFRNNLSNRVSFNPDYSHVADLDFYLRFEAVNLVGCIDESLVTYRQHDRQMHNDSVGLKLEYPVFLSGINLTTYNLKERKVLGNVYAMAALLEIRSGSFVLALKDLTISLRFRPIAFFVIPIRILEKRVIGLLNQKNHIQHAPNV